MICPLCKQDKTLNHVLKLQRIVEGKNKENLNEIHVCEKCANELSVIVTNMLTFGEPVCKWTEDSDGNYDTDCGNCFSMIDGTPEENNMRYCNACGRKVNVIHYRIEGMCCDCLQPDRHSICGDYSENELCKHRKEDGSCWK